MKAINGSLWTLVQYAERPDKVRILWATGFILVSSFLILISSHLLGQMVSFMTSKDKNVFSLIVTYGAWFFCLEAISVAFLYYGRQQLALATVETIRHVRHKMFQQMYNLPLPYFQNTPFGVTITRLTSDVEGVEDFFSGGCSRILASTIQIIFVMCGMLIFDLYYGSILVGLSLLSLGYVWGLSPVVHKWLRIAKLKNATLNARLAEFLGGFRTIHMLDQTPWADRQIQQANNGYLSTILTLLKWNSLIRPSALLLSALPTFFILWYGSSQVLIGALSLPTLVSLIRLTERFISPVRTISQEVQVVQEAFASSLRLEEFLQEPDETAYIGPNGHIKKQLEGRVQFKNVVFSYQTGQTVLNGISFTASPGQVIALVGATGSGKSSTVNLIPFLHPLYSGEVLIDDIPVQSWDRANLRQQIGYCMQDTTLLRGTLFENLCGYPLSAEHRFPAEQIRRACEESGLAFLLNRFPQGLKTTIEDGGENLSMGERQMISLTRILLRSPRILILDEASSHMDPECERIFHSVLECLMRGRTCFLVAHRLETIRNSHHILVYEQGRIVESGTWDHLINKRAKFYALYSKNTL